MGVDEKRRLSEYACKRKVKHCRVASWKCGDAFLRHARSREQLKAGAQCEPPHFTTYFPHSSKLIHQFSNTIINILYRHRLSSIFHYCSSMNLHSSGNIELLLTSHVLNTGAISIMIHRASPDIQIPSSTCHQASPFFNGAISSGMSSWQSERSQLLAKFLRSDLRILTWLHWKCCHEGQPS